MQGQRKLVLQLLDDSGAQVPEWPSATVAQVQPGAAADGLPLVTVRYRGGSYQFPYLVHYTPTVGDTVVLGRVGGNWAIVGRLGGFPPA